MSINKVTLLGNVGKEPTIFNTQSGSKLAKLSLATTEKWKDKSGQKQEKTEWHNVIIMSDGLAKVVERYVKKGDKLYLEGKLQTRKYTNKEGADVYTTEVILSGFDSKLEMLSKSKGDAYEETAEIDQDLNDEIPF